MPMLHRKDIVFTNQRMVLKGIYLLICLGFPSLLIAQKLIDQMMQA